MDMSTTPVLEKDPRAEAAIARWQELDAERGSQRRDWEDIDRLMRGVYAEFSRGDTKRQEKTLTSAPMIAAQNLTAGLFGTITNPANRWMATTVGDPDLADWQPMREWLDMVSGRILASFRPSVSPFYSAVLQTFGDTVCFGTSVAYSETQASERRIMDATLSIDECVLEIDAFGQVVELVRKYRLTGEQAAARFGLSRLPAALARAAERRDRARHDFYWHVRKNDAQQRGRIGAAGKAWTSLHVAATGCAVLRDGGYDEMPFTAPRWDVATGQTWGRGPGHVALPEARALTRMDEATLRAAQRAADPTLLAPDREAMPLKGAIRPGEVVYGGVNLRGERMIQPLDTVSGTGLTLEMQQRRIESIRDAFYWSMMTLAGRTGMTATEVIERQEEKLRLMAPYQGRIQNEHLAPVIGRRFGMLWRAGQIPPPPPGTPPGTTLEVEYQSAAALAQKSAEGAAIVRLLSDIVPLAQMGKTRALDRISEDDLLEALVEARGAPARVIVSREEADRASQQRAQMQQMQQMLAAGQAGAGIARDAASAEAMLQRAQG